MAVSFPDLIADAFLKLLSEKPISKITVKDLQKSAGISRQTFYNHFLDKDDLIQYIYLHRIIPEFHQTADPFDFERHLLHALENMQQHADFLRQAFSMCGPNALPDFAAKHCEKFDLAFHEKAYGAKMPPDLVTATIYHSKASTALITSWILTGMHTDPKEMAHLICSMRRAGIKEWIGSLYK